MDIDIEKIRQLAELAADKGLAELSVSDGTQTITLKMPIAQSVAVQTLMPPSGFAQGYAYGNTTAFSPEPPNVSDPNRSAGSTGIPASSSSSTADKNIHVITAPMVGTFYRSPSPDSPAFVEVGHSIKPGQTLCILEAMKQMNQLEAEVSGKIVEVLLENGTPVEYGQPLFKVNLG